MNWLAILCAGAAYWVLGYVWYSLLFGKIWAAEQARQQGERPPPTGGEMAGKMIGTFICNLLAAAAMAYIFYKAQTRDLNHALRLGAATGIGFAGTAITMKSIWESKPTKIWMIDAGFNLVGCLLVAAIIVYWRM
jgi:formate/nitrite transporter FocA (FNT family)